MENVKEEEWRCEREVQATFGKGEERKCVSSEEGGGI